MNKRIKKEGNYFPLLKMNKNGVLTTVKNIYVENELTPDQFNEIYSKVQSGNPVILMTPQYSDEPKRPVPVISISERYGEKFIYYIFPSIDEAATDLSCSIVCLSIRGDVVQRKAASFTLGTTGNWYSPT